MDMDKLRGETDMVAVIGSRVQLTRRGREFAACCPFHEDSTPSFFVMPEQGFWHCFGCQASGDVVAFVQRFDGLEFKDAVAAIQSSPAVLLPVRSGLKAVNKEVDWVTEVPPETDPAPASMATRQYGDPTAVWCYKTLDGNPWGYAARYMIKLDGNERKAVLQWTYGRSVGETMGRWACKHFSRPRPLYGLEHLYQADKRVLVVEGEKTADAARVLFPQDLVVTWPGGAAAVKYADWTPLSGRECVMIPDADASGKQAANTIQERLVNLGCRVTMVSPESSRPDGWDLADALADEWHPDEAGQWLAANAVAEAVVVRDTAVVPVGMPSAFSEDSLAQTFAEARAGDIRYVKTWGAWMHWNDRHWDKDEQNVILEKARAFLCEAVNWEAGQVMPEAFRRKVNALHTVRAVVEFASFNPLVSTTAGQWDVDPLLLSTPEGAVELRTGTLRPARREDYLIQSTSVTPSDGECPVWLRFLDTVMNHDQTLVDYLHRLAGYALTGMTVEQQISFFYGTGGNGKSVFLSALRAILGTYASTAPMSAFTESKIERHPTDIAGLKDARLVVSQETEEGRRWAESLIKSLTGGDPIKARYMRQDFFEFIPKFKLIFAGNHKPSLRTVDEAMRRRMHIVPWIVTIPADQRDPMLGDKLKAEYPAILQWMIQGCLKWQQQGLNPPEAVLRATEEYLEEEDSLRLWLDENCILDPIGSVQSKEIYQNYVAWCEEAKEFPMSHKRLISNLSARGCQTMRLAGARSIVGVSLKVVEPVRSW